MFNDKKHHNNPQDTSPSVNVLLKSCMFVLNKSIIMTFLTLILYT